MNNISGGFFRRNNTTTSFKKIEYDDGQYYEGEVDNNGNRSGRGVYYWSDNARLEAEWINNAPIRGTRFYSSGHKYEGEFDLNGNRSGEGMHYDANGVLILEGKWENDILRLGTNHYESGNRYEGEFDENGNKSGEGKFYDANGVLIFEGKWENNGIRLGTYYYGSSRYEGEFDDTGEKSGTGVYYWEGGSHFHGQWFDGLKHGYGKYYNSSNVLIHEGNWEMGILESNANIAEESTPKPISHLRDIFNPNTKEKTSVTISKVCKDEYGHLCIDAIVTSGSINVLDYMSAYNESHLKCHLTILSIFHDGTEVSFATKSQNVFIVTDIFWNVDNESENNYVRLTSFKEERGLASLESEVENDLTYYVNKVNNRDDVYSKEDPMEMLIFFRDGCVDNYINNNNFDWLKIMSNEVKSKFALTGCIYCLEYIRKQIVGDAKLEIENCKWAIEEVAKYKQKAMDFYSNITSSSEFRMVEIVEEYYKSGINNIAVDIDHEKVSKVRDVCKEGFIPMFIWENFCNSLS